MVIVIILFSVPRLIVNNFIKKDCQRSVVGMFCHFFGDLDSHKALCDVVRPEEMQHLQSDHHKAHEAVGEVQYLELKWTHAIGNDIGDGVDGCVDAAITEEDDPAEHPTDECVDINHIQQFFRAALVVLVGTGEDECKVTVVVDQQHEDTNDPLVGQVAEHDQEHRQAVVKRILEEIALGFDEDMRKEAAEVLARLADVEDLHFQCCLRDARCVVKESEGTAESTEPGGHELRAHHDLVGPGRTKQVVANRISPLHQRVAPLDFLFWLGVALLSDVVLLAERVEDVMDEQVVELDGVTGTVNATAKGILQQMRSQRLPLRISAKCSWVWKMQTFWKRKAAIPRMRKKKAFQTPQYFQDKPSGKKGRNAGISTKGEYLFGRTGDLSRRGHWLGNWLSRRSIAH